MICDTTSTPDFFYPIQSILDKLIPIFIRTIPSSNATGIELVSSTEIFIFFDASTNTISNCCYNILGFLIKWKWS